MIRHSHRDSNAVCHLFYQPYRDSFVYWEILETGFRLLLIAVLPYFRQAYQSSQLVNAQSL